MNVTINCKDNKVKIETGTKILKNLGKPTVA